MDFWQAYLEKMYGLLPLFLMAAFGVAFMIWISRNNKKKAREEAEKRERKEPVACPYCGRKAYPGGELRPFFKCADCGRHFAVNRDLTPDEQEIVRKEEEDRERHRMKLPDIDMYK